MFSRRTGPNSNQANELPEAEITPITPELLKKSRTSPNSAIIPFYWKPANQPDQRVRIPRNGSWGWDNYDFVRLPMAHKAPNEWNKKITANLEALKQFALTWCERDQAKQRNIINPIDWFEDVIKNYCYKAKYGNFDVFRGDWELARRLMYALPGIIDQALKLPVRLRNWIPILKQWDNKTICLTRDLACSLIANAFLCTFPEQFGRNLPYFNFWSLFSKNEWAGQNYTEVVAQVKREKVKCFLAYFEEMSKNPKTYQNSIITYERRRRFGKVPWSTSTLQFCDVEVRSQEKLELCQGMLQVDFANKVVGGGVLNDGAVQEEIRFCISPELMCARLFTEPLMRNEALVVTGTLMFSSYTGYRDSFKYQPLNCSEPMFVDDLGRQGSQVVAMDALCFRPDEREVQYKPEKIDRELHKCYVAFIQGRRATPVATGNWGCGAFNGDPQLKFLIQWMAATQTGRAGVRFHAWGDQQKKEIEDVVALLQGNKVTVGQLYSGMMKFEGMLKKKQGKTTLFQIIQEALKS